MRPIAVVASPAPAVLKRGRQALQKRFAIQEATDHAALARSVAALKPQFAFVDVSLPRLGGIRGISAIQRLNPQTAIVVLSSSVDAKEGVAALKAGARGYCHKDLAPSQLRKATECIEKGEFWAGRKIVSHVLDELAFFASRHRVHHDGRAETRLQRLSQRRREVAFLVAGGASNRQIASRLRVSEKTIKGYLTAIFRTLDIPNRLQLALFVTEQAGAVRASRRFGRAAG